METTADSTVLDVRLCYDTCATDVRDGLPFMFGELVKLTKPVLKAYESDLYHDALWIDQNASGDRFVFWWSVNDTGTTIGHDADSAYRVNRYRFELSLNDGSTRLRIDRYSPPGSA